MGDIKDIEAAQTVKIVGTSADGTETTPINSEGDRLKVESKPSVDDQVNTLKMVCLLDEVVRQLRILNTHMECITDLDKLEEEPGDHPIV